MNKGPRNAMSGNGLNKIYQFYQGDYLNSPSELCQKSVSGCKKYVDELS